MRQLVFAAVCVVLLLRAQRASAQCDQIGVVCAGPFTNCSQRLCELQSVSTASAVFVETVQDPFSPEYPTGLDVSYNNEYLSFWNSLSSNVHVFQNNGGTFELASNHTPSYTVRSTLVSNSGDSVITTGRNAVAGEDGIVIYERSGISLSRVQGIAVVDDPDTSALYTVDVSTDGTRMVWYNDDGADGIVLRVFERSSDTGTFTEVTSKEVSNANNQALNTNTVHPADCNNDCTVTSLAYDDNSGAAGYNLFVVERDGGSWTRTALPQPAVAGEEGPPYELFSVSLNAAGDFLMFGDPKFTIGGTLTGRVLFYERSGGTWSYHSEFRNPSPHDFYGYDVMLQPTDGPAGYVNDAFTDEAYYLTYNGTHWNSTETFTGLEGQRNAISNGGQSVFFSSSANSGADWYTRSSTFTCSIEQPAPSTYQCHTAAGQCDKNTTCSGTSTGCPNFYKSRGASCTVSANATDPFDAGCYSVQCSGSSATCGVNTNVREGSTCDIQDKKRALPQGTCKLSDLCRAGLCIENAGTDAFAECNVGGTVHATFPCVGSRRCVAMLAEG